MDPLLAGALTILAGVTIVAAAAGFITLIALKGTASQDRAAVLESVAKIVAALRGRR
ncbi:hypothetical protein [Streptomyces sp. CA-132043]|uniref:hypothetical protein n=1 Tax=Streptomyces sp. CA-132043 TaxID=3240048 RepID=UPI003D90AFD1